MTMSTSIESKLREMRIAEGLTQKDFAQLVELSLGTVKNYESGHSKIGLKNLLQILRHTAFSKYTLWVVNDKTSPESGQIAP